MTSPWKTRHYLEFLEDIGEGGFGQVSKALHTIERKLYAIKTIGLLKSINYFEGNVEHVYRESILLQKLCHENVVRHFSNWIEGPDEDKLQDIFKNMEFNSQSLSNIEEKNFLFIQMEFCETNLKNWLAENQLNYDFRAQQALSITLQLAEGLDYVHKKQIIHRDLKPLNVLGKFMEEKVMWKLADFGLAKDVPENVSNFSSTKGAGFYSSPDKDVTEFSDVFSLGLIFIEVISSNFDRAKANDFLSNYGGDEKFLEDIRAKVAENLRHVFDVAVTMVNPRGNQRPSASKVLSMLRNEEAIKKDTHPGLQEPEGKSPYEFNLSKLVYNFAGREHLLTKIRKAYENINQTIVTLVGFGGIGKSELARRFGVLAQNENQWDVVWLDCDSPENFSSCFLRLVQEQEIDLKILNGDYSCDNILRNAGNLFLIMYPKFSRKVLLILDNINKLEGFEKFFTSFRKIPPRNGAPFILVTTRVVEVSQRLGGEVIEVNVLEDYEAISLVNYSLKKVSQNDDENVLNLCISLKNFPLALQQAVSYIREQNSKRKYSIFEYLKLFQAQKKKLLNFQLNLNDYNYLLTTMTTWQISFDAITSNEEFGEMAEEILNFFAYILDPNLKKVCEVIEIIEIYLNPVDFKRSKFREEIDGYEFFLYDIIPTTEIETIISGEIIERCKCWRRRDSLPNTYARKGFFPDEIDLEDDFRTVAEAIKLIRNYSICCTQIRWDGGMDRQIFTLHNLVLEVIRKGKSDKEERSVLKKLFKKFENENFLEWSLDSEKTFKIREEMIDNILSHSLKHGQLTREISEVCLALWHDSCPGYIPNFGKGKFGNIATFLGENSSVDIISVLIMRKYEAQETLQEYLLNSDSSKLYPWIMKRKVKDYAPNLMGKGFPKNTLDFKVLGINFLQLVSEHLELKHEIIAELVGISLFSGLVSEESLFSSEDSCKIFLFACEFLRSNERFLPPTRSQITNVLLGFLSRILENEETNLPAFLKSLSSIFKKLEREKFLALFGYVSYIIIRFGNMRDLDFEVFEKDVSKIVNVDDIFFEDWKEVLVPDKIVLFQVAFGKYYFCPSWLIGLFLEDAFSSDFSIWPIPAEWYFGLMNTLINKSCFDPVVEFGCLAVEKSYALCKLERFSSAMNLLLRTKMIVETLWDVGRYNDCIQICKGLSPLCQFGSKWEESDFVGKWMDGLVLKAIQVGIQAFPKAITAVNDTATTVATSSEMGMVPKHVFPATDSHKEDEVYSENTNEDPSTSTNIVINFQEVDEFWQKQDFTGWQEMVVSALKVSIPGYMESKMASYIHQKLDQIDIIPPKVLSWAFLYIFDNHTNLDAEKNKFLDKIPKVIDILLSQEGETGLRNLGIYIAEGGKATLNFYMSNPEESGRFSIVGLSKIWHSLFICGVIIERLKGQENVNLYETLLSIKEHDTALTFPVLTKVFCKLIQHTERKSFKTPIKVLGNLLKNTSGDSSEIALIDTCATSVLDECLRSQYFKHLVHFCNSFEEVSTPLSEKFNIIKIAENLPKETRADAFSIFKHALNFNYSDELQKKIDNFNTLFLDSLLKAREELGDETADWYFLSHARAFLKFIFKNGSESIQLKNLVLKIINQFYPFGNYQEIYKFGLDLAFIPQNKVRLEAKFKETLETFVDALRSGCENDVERMKRIFEMESKIKIDEYSCRRLYLEMVDKLFTEFDIKFLDDEYSDEWNSDYLENSDDEIRITLEGFKIKENNEVLSIGSIPEVIVD